MSYSDILNGDTEPRVASCFRSLCPNFVELISLKQKVGKLCIKTSAKF